ncbi:hypothetical protein NM688_g3771 [Phlebia brevispora]|uniref:Uncharacterized protein n=1 Tax=Phlebia brevispora TaxID=194682 RepID=A0ACC1T521_9APHY|nr:hypothetical protein NM688_g3771 [Phlebia brevispora]
MSPPCNCSAPLPTLPTLQFKLDNTVGALYIATIIAAIFYGLTTIQCYIYFPHRATDPKPFRIVSAVLRVLDTADLALISQYVYYYSVTNFANPAALLEAPPTLGGLQVQRQEYVSWWSHWLRDIGILYRGPRIKAKYVAKFVGARWLVYSTITTGAVADVMIASSLCFMLWTRRTGLSHSRTDSMVNTLMLYAINTGALTSCLAVVAVIMFAIMPDNDIYLGLLFVLPKLLFNSLLANLNARPTLKTHDLTWGIPTIPVSSLDPSSTFPPRQTGDASGSSQDDRPVLAIKTET